MDLRLLILFLGTCSSHWTLATAAPSVTYDLSEGTLKNVRATDARNISLSNLGVEHLDANSLNALEKVVSLDLSNNGLGDLPPKIFSNFLNLRELSLSNNRLSSFNSSSVGLTNLEYLDLSRNNIRILNRGDLFGLNKSGKVIISHSITEISSGIFQDPSVPVLTENNTDSYENYGESDLPYRGPFKICISGDGILESINMAENDYKGICTSQSQTNQSHRVRNMTYDAPIWLNVVECNITDVENSAFGKLNWKYLDFMRNRLRSTAFVKKLPKTIRKLILSINPISEVPLDSFYGMRNLTELLMDNMEVQNIEPGTFRDQENLSELWLEWNKISVLKPGFFQGLNSLKTINLRGNRITKIPSNLFEGYNHLSPKLYLYLDYNSIKIIENGAFSRMNLRELDLKNNPLEDDSIQEGAFNGSVIRKISLDSDALTRFNGEWFNGVSGLKVIFLGSSSVQRLEKGLAKHMKDVISLQLLTRRVKVLQNGALFGLSTEKRVRIRYWGGNLTTIEGGLFDDL